MHDTNLAFDPNHADLLQAALHYAARGWPVLPLHGGTEYPILLKKPWGATTNPVRIKQYWASWPDANVAISTGRASNLIVVESDPEAGSEKILEQLTAELTLTATTPAGGVQYFFRYPSGVNKIRSGRLAPGLDLKADGAYAVVPPSILYR
jgi:hypothetical protein